MRANECGFMYTCVYIYKYNYGLHIYIYIVHNYMCENRSFQYVLSRKTRNSIYKSYIKSIRFASYLGDLGSYYSTCTQVRLINNYNGRKNKNNNNSVTLMVHKYAAVEFAILQMSHLKPGPNLKANLEQNPQCSHR